jgi:polyhydroxybutyrate depolymerase
MKPESSVLTTLALFILYASLLGLTVNSAGTLTAQEKGPGTGTGSPDTRIGLGGEDYRTRVQWIKDGEIADNQKSGDYGRKLEFQGEKRFYEVHVPPGYTAKKPVPAVLVLHGGGGYPGAVRYESGMDRVSDAHGFLAIYPAGASETGGLFTDRLLLWNDGRTKKKDPKGKRSDDVAFIAAVLDDTARFFTIDPDRIYATGISNGACMACRIASQLSDRIAAAASVAGPRTIDAYYPGPTRPLSIMFFHGLGDTIAPYGGGTPASQPWVERRFSVQEAVKSWIAHNGCPEMPAQKKKIRHATMTLYGPGKEGTEVVLWTLEDGGHTWPGGKRCTSEITMGVGPVNNDICASDVMWEFFERHPRK